MEGYKYLSVLEMICYRETASFVEWKSVVLRREDRKIIAVTVEFHLSFHLS